jgi:hypothetical protein
LGWVGFHKIRKQGNQTYLDKNRAVHRIKGDGAKGVRREFGDHMMERRQLGLEVGYDGDVLALGKQDGDVEEQHTSIIMMTSMRGSLLAQRMNIAWTRTQDPVAAYQNSNTVAIVLTVERAHFGALE